MNKSNKTRKSKVQRKTEKARELSESDFGSALNRFSMPSNIHMGSINLET